MPLKYAYHPGNVAHSGSPEVADTMDAVARNLGLELTPLEGATSCGAGIIKQANQRLQLALNARTFAMAESLGLEILTPCAATAGNLKQDLEKLRSDNILMKEINDVLIKTCDMEFTGNTEVHHLLHVLVDEIGLDKVEKLAVNKFDFRVAPYYSPYFQMEGACGGDSVNDPEYFEQLVQSLGGNPIDWEGRVLSVGAPGIFSEEPTVLRQSAAVISEAKEEGADIIVSACNLSHSILDIYQGKASRATGIITNIPVIHLTELLSFAFGNHNTRFAQLRTRIAVIGD
ncbi:MAG: heterodisulfide reductase-related iron-sulfur binding cluster [Candidatus Thermoplasmatota archaeon]|nr:heterodisulfide reductase-related iron-sulfur binding cluster [Candidatus Thermoplasmatota archaeon]